MTGSSRSCATTLLLYQRALFSSKINRESLYTWHMVLSKGLPQMLQNSITLLYKMLSLEWEVRTSTSKLRTAHWEHCSMLSLAPFQIRTAKHKIGSWQQTVWRKENKSSTFHSKNQTLETVFLITERKENKSSWQQDHKKPRTEKSAGVKAGLSKTWTMYVKGWSSQTCIWIFSLSS